MVEIHGRIIDSIHRSTVSCYMVFGELCPNARIPSLSEEKYVAVASHRIEQLDIDINTRRLEVIYPPFKPDAF